MIHYPNQKPTAESIMNDLPDSVLLEILHRLPCKAAVRCKSVSKRWFALISEPHFLRQFLCRQRLLLQDHRPRHQDRHCSFVFHGKDVLIIPEVPSLDLASVYRKFFFTIPWNSKVIASFNGLLLCSKSEFFPRRDIFFICDPFTGHLIELPQASTTDHFGIRAGIIGDPYYQIDPETETMVINSSPKFRVVCVLQYFQQQFECICKVFSSETGSWSHLVLPCPQWCFAGSEPPAIVYNGKLLLMGSTKILAYDPYKEGDNNGVRDQKQFFRFIDVPADASKGFQLGCLGLSSGCLQICQYAPEVHNNTPHVRVWELKDYDEGTWCLRHKVYLNEVTKDPTYQSMYDGCKLLAFHPYDKDVMYLVCKERFVCWNLQRKSYIDGGGSQGNGYSRAITIDLPFWPTPMPKITSDSAGVSDYNP